MFGICYERGYGMAVQGFNRALQETRDVLWAYGQGRGSRAIRGWRKASGERGVAAGGGCEGAVVVEVEVCSPRLLGSLVPSLCRLPL